MTQFEDALWAAVVDRHGDDLATVAGTRRSRFRPAVPVGVAGGLAAAAAVVLLLLGSAASPSPAFAMTVHHQSVSLTIYRHSGIAKANRRLAAMGIRDHLANVQAGQTVTLLCVADNAAESGGQTPTYAIRTMASPQSLPSVGTTVPGSGWEVVACPASAGTGTTPASGNTGTTPAG